MSDLSKRRLKLWIRLLGVTRGAETTCATICAANMTPPCPALT